MESLQQLVVAPEKFKMEALPLYAAFLHREKLDAFVKKLLQLSVDAELPLLKKLEHFSDEQIIEIGRVSHGETLDALANNCINSHIEKNVKKWAANNLEVVDRNDLVAADVTLLSYIKRKAMGYFIDDYTSDLQLKQQLLMEIDNYTTQEELISHTTYMKIQQDHLNRVNSALAFQESLLLEAQEISELGSYFLDYINPEKSVYTPQTLKITGINGGAAETFFSYIHPEDFPAIKEIWDQAIQNGGPFEYSFRYVKDGIEKQLQSRGIVTLENNTVQHVKGTLRDITKVDFLIRRLTESERLHKEAQKLTHLGNWSWEIGTDNIVWSDEMYRIYGIEPQSEKITFERFLTLIHPDNREQRIREINESLQTGVVTDYTLKIETAKGEIKILRGFGSVENREGIPVKLVGTCQDITHEHQLQTELLVLNEMLSHKNTELLASNKELESFNYIASHDLQEPLRKIQIYTEKIIHQTEHLDPAIVISLEKVMNAAARMRNLINDLMSFSQVSLADLNFENLSLNDVVAEACEAFADSIASGDSIINVSVLPNAKVIRFQFLQLMTNIIGNAIKYKKKDTPVQINISATIVSGLQVNPMAKAENYIQLTLADNGIGFAPEYAETIFDLFKRLHRSDQYSGTGIGLAICKKIVQNHHGFITAQGELTKGSTFKIYIPR